MESREESIKRKRVQYEWIDTWAESESKCLSCTLMQFKSLKMGISSSFPLANHFDLPGSLSIFGISQDPSVDVHASLSVDGSYHKGLWVA